MADNEHEHDEGYYLNDERRALLYEARDKQMKMNLEAIADHENGMPYCPLCRELWEENHKCKSESEK